MIESKTSKSIGVLLKGSLHLIRHANQNVSRLYRYKDVSYIGYGNIAWVSISQNKLKKIFTKQKNFVPIIFHEEKEAYARSFLKEIHALKIYQINILQILTFEHFWRN